MLYPAPQKRSARWPGRLMTIAGFLAASAMVNPAMAQSQTQTQTTSDFDQCLAELGETAVRAGVSRETATAVVAGVEQIERVIELDRKQPEFTTTFADYLNRRVNESRIQQGRELLKTHRDLLNRVTRETGVPGPYLLAFWGLETNFGSYFGKMSVPGSLATLACDERRSEFFTRQWVAALQIIDEGAIPAEQMEGSWAGAMGHVQFMPTVFLEHAVDADGDGRRDLWNSLPDALMSAGHFLDSMGWNGDYRWGREVLLPGNFDYRLSDGRELPLARWREMGITDAFGRPLAQDDIEASLLVPAGHRGPAFLVYQNFDVIMGWNRSEFYAIAVGHLADRIAGAGGLQVPPPEDLPALSRQQILDLQQALASRGYDPGPIDGILGSGTRSAIREFQKANDLVADGYPGTPVLDAVGIDT